tara:strand:- start:2306 stop:4627 length:2322 start_codon:yes stop_codon:yes gene_type:complete
MAISDINVKLTADIKDFQSKMTKASKGFKKFGSGMSAAGKSMTTALTGPIAALGVGAVMAAANFEKSMNKVKAVTGSTAKEFEDLNSQALLLGSTTQFSASQAADAMGFLGQAGFEANEILEAMPATLSLAAAGGLDLAQAADIASNILSGFGAEASELGYFADVMAMGFTSSNTSLEGLGNAMAMVAPVASGFGISLEETTAAIGKLSDAGIQGESAGTGLRGVLATLSSKAKQLGINVFDASGKMLPLRDSLAQIEKKGLSTAEIMEVFGKKAGPSMLALLKVGSKGLQDFTTDLENSGGTAEEIAAVQLEGLTGDMTMLKSAVEGVAIQFGSKLSPVISSIAKKFTELAGWINSLTEEQVESILKWGAFIAAIGPVLMIFGSIASGVGSVISVISVLGPILMTMASVALPFLSTAFSYLFAIMMANPFIAIAAAITAVSFAIYKFITAEDEVIETTEDAVDAKKELVEVTEDETKATDEAAAAELALAENLTKVEKAVVKVNTAVGLNVKGLVDVKKAAEDIPEGLKGFKFDTGGGDAPKLRGGRPDASGLPAAEVGSVSGIEQAAAGLDTMSNKVAAFAEEYGAAIDGIFETFNLGIETQNLKLDAQHAKELERINGSKKSEEEKAKAIEALEKKTDEKRTKLKRKQAIADKAAAISQAIINTAVQVASVVANVPLAILVGAMGAMQVGMIASQPIPFADGGLVTGPTMGLVGEGRGTTRSNPEVIAPLDKLKGMIGGGAQEVIVRGVISGDDLLLVHDRATRREQRIG